MWSGSALRPTGRVRKGDTLLYPWGVRERVSGAVQSLWRRVNADLVLWSGVALPLIAAWLDDLIDLVIRPLFSPSEHSAGLDPLAMLSGTAVVGLALALLTRRATPTVLMAGGLLAPVVVPAVAWLRPTDVGWGAVLTALETVGLLVVLATVVSRGRPLLAVATTTLFFVVAAVVVRDHNGNLTGLFFGIVLFGLVGLYLRLRAAQRRNHAEQARHQERMAMSRDLHDTVAFHASGIAVQVQALRHTPDLPTEAVRDALPDIEDAATQTLDSTRRMVRTLREPHSVRVRPVDPAAELRELRRPKSDDHPRVEVELHGPVADLPTEIGTAVTSVAQESVTNAVRHARHASLVRARVNVRSDSVELEVDDDGAGKGSLFAHGHGYGLVGMAERVRLLGGELDAGPAQQHRGWRVHAHLPLSSTRAVRRNTGREIE